MTHDVNAIVVSDCSFAYAGRTAITAASFTVKQGDFLGMIGPNGGGKTTLLRLMLGLLKPDSGSISIFGDVPEKGRRTVGYIPQETGLNKQFPVSVRDVLLMGFSGTNGLFRILSRNNRKTADAMLELLGLSDIADRPIGEISGGQRQKALLGRAMIAKPRILFLDEPTASVDAKGEDEIYGYLHRINGEGVTIVLVTHNTGAISRYVKSVACVNRSVYFHADGRLDGDTITKTFGCPIDLIAHGVPHRVLHDHEGEA